ncbi:MAG: Chromate resistance protein ChrB [Thermomicrobiales bacterium]
MSDERTTTARAWVLLVYRVPTEPASKRVGVWRDLKRLGTLYLQQCVCILPAEPALLNELSRIAARIPDLGGEYTLFDIPRLQAADEERIVAAFRALRDKEYAEIIEECETKFVKEVEFEHFRQNYSFEEAEEIGQDLEKIRRWFDRIVARDWFGTSRRGDVTMWIERCQELLNEFEHEVYRRRGDDGDSDAPALPTPVANVRGTSLRAIDVKKEADA